MMMTLQNQDKIRIGISSCLLGHEVRYNGGHKRDRYITDVLAEHFEFVPFCPEVAIGLGIPRPTLRLLGSAQSPRAVYSEDPDFDVTDALADYGRDIGQNSAPGLSGYILKSKSPSCGMERVKVYSPKGSPFTTSSGIYAQALMQAQPLLPVEEEGRLNDDGLRDNFIERVFIYHRWQSLQAQGMTAKDLIAFHTEHKFLLLAHNQQVYRSIGRLVAEAGTLPIDELCATYIEQLMQALRQPATRNNHVNVLLHLAGYFKKQLDQRDKEELQDAIENYRSGELPLIVPLTLIRHHQRRHSDTYLADQRYLELRTAPLDTRR